MEIDRGVVAALLAVVLTLAAVPAFSGAVRDRGSSLPDTVTLFVAVPADHEINYGDADAALHEAELAMRWIESKAGRTFRRGPGFAQVIQLDNPESRYQRDFLSAVSLIADDVLVQAGREDTFPVIIALMTTEAAPVDQSICGVGGPAGLVMFTDNCRGQHLSTTSTWGTAASITLAHELLHGLGAVADCAPHAGQQGHVVDDPTDIMRATAVHEVPPQDISMDAARDDYFNHDIEGCPDIADSPLWTRQ